MSKTNNAPAIDIEAGKAIPITAESRKEAADKLKALRKQAEEAGLVQAAGGFIDHREGIFSAVITFVEH